MTEIVLAIGLVVAALPVALASAYLLVLTLLSGRPRPPVPGAPRTRFDLVVPAHDEEAGIARTVRSLAAVDYPPELRRIVVVADNCSDATAALARQAGAIVLERVDPERRGKGYALEHAFRWVLESAWCDAVVVVDADSLVSANLPAAFSARLATGARAIQADYVVGNPGASWRTTLLAIAFTMVHAVRSRGRQRLALSVGLRGNGMCFAREVVEQIPHHAFSVVEDLEYGIRLGLAGIRVDHAGEVVVSSEMLPGATGSVSQRLRWEGGRRAMARQWAGPLLRRGLGERSPLLLDLGLDLLVPPLATLGAAATFGVLASAALVAASASGRAALLVWSLALAGLLVHVGRGWWLSGTGLAGLAGLLFAPGYLAWKLAVRPRRTAATPAAWVRTARPPGQETPGPRG